MIDPFTTLAVAATLALTAPAPLPSKSAATDLSRPAATITSPAEWVTPDDYPPMAIRTKQEGTSQITFRVLPNGRVTGCETDQSSGSDLLDAMACALVQTRARYTPELDGKGRAVESASKTLRFTWRLPKDDPIPQTAGFGAPFRFEMEVDIDAAGKVADCRVVTRTGTAPVPLGDPCLEVRASPGVTPLAKDGKPVPSRMTIVSSLSHAPR
ncbi:energy transducer TonB [Sphingomonas arantia]|uniref:Energy transducer TonB n=1 Tax=Sphingomonas arantia TaxID=1460676 RepID=A0ABW4U436_9SPHN